jgi:hypothetical protein
VRALIGRTYDLDCELAALRPLIAADCSHVAVAAGARQILQ